MSHLPQYQTIPEIEPVRTELGSACELAQLELARRSEDAYEEGASKATAALFAGMLMGSGSTVLMMWLVTLIF